METYSEKNTILFDEDQSIAEEGNKPLDVSKSIKDVFQIIEQRKYLVNEGSGEQSESRSLNKLSDQDEEFNKSEKMSVYFKEDKDFLKKTFFECETCGKCFKKRSHLYTHIKIHTNEKPFQCIKCEKRFVQAIHLKTHEKTHIDEKPYECSICKKCFAVTSYLKNM